MTDRKMFEFAAKAAGMVLEYEAATGRYFYWRNPYDSIRNVQNLKVFWNPRDDDGDSFRLMVALRLCQLWQHDWLMVYSGDVSVRERDLKDPRAATRLAIFRAAVEIGRNMK